LEKLSGRSNVVIISKRHSSLSNKFYDRNHTLRVEAVSSIVRIDWPDWLVLYQFFIAINLRLNVIVASLCSIECSCLLRRSRACFQSKIPFLTRRCAHLVISAHISLQVRHLTQVCEGEKRSQLLSSTSPLWSWITLVVHFRDKFLSFLCYETSCFKNDVSSQCQKEPIGWPEGPETHIVASSDSVSHVIYRVYRDTFWRSSAAALQVKLVLFSPLCRSKSVTTCSSIFCSLHTNKTQTASAISTIYQSPNYLW